jgi:hypothetical protein
MKTLIHVEALPASDNSALSVRVVRQDDRVARRLPFFASNGVTFRVLPSGRPFAGLVGGKLTVGLRGPGGEAYAGTPVTSRFGDARQALQAARDIREGVAELRRACNEIS